jgi:hypothetical protein
MVLRWQILGEGQGGTDKQTEIVQGSSWAPDTRIIMGASKYLLEDT